MNHKLIKCVKFLPIEFSGLIIRTVVHLRINMLDNLLTAPPSCKAISVPVAIASFNALALGTGDVGLDNRRFMGVRRVDSRELRRAGLAQCMRSVHHDLE